MLMFFLFACATFTAMISGIIGMGGGVTLLAVMSALLPLQVVIPIHGVLQLNSNVMRSLFLRHNIRKEVFLMFVFGVPIGALAAYFFVQEFFSEKLVLGLILVFIFYSLFKPKKFPEFRLNQFQFFILAIVSGFFGILIGATGPLLAPFFLRSDFTKEQIVATKASSQIVIHLVKLPVFLALGFDYLEHIDMILLMMLGIMIGTQMGILILKKTTDKYFVMLYKVVLGAVALRLLYKVLM